MKTTGKTLFFAAAVLALFSCNKENSLKKGSVTDADGNEYTTVKFSGAEWTASNLKTTTYSDGTAIPNITEDEDWKNNDTAGAYCFFKNDPESPFSNGALYNWHAVNTGKLCPEGWHVATNSDWEDLAEHMGGEDVAGKKLLDGDFNATGGDTRESYGSFSPQPDNIFSYWWTATESSEDDAIGKRVHATNSSSFPELKTYSSLDKRKGMGVRCVKD